MEESPQSSISVEMTEAKDEMKVEERTEGDGEASPSTSGNQKQKKNNTSTSSIATANVTPPTEEMEALYSEMDALNK